MNVHCLLFVGFTFIFVALVPVFYCDNVQYLLGCFSGSVLMYLCNRKR